MGFQLISILIFDDLAVNRLHLRMTILRLFCIFCAVSLQWFDFTHRNQLVNGGGDDLERHYNAPPYTIYSSVRCIDANDDRTRLKLNAEKTQLIWIRQQLAKLTVTQLQLINSVVEFDSTATNLDVVLDGQLSMSQQVTAVCCSCFYHLRQLKSVRAP